VRRSLLVYNESLSISELSVLNALELEQQWSGATPASSRGSPSDP
jgi:hypothetical protein